MFFSKDPLTRNGPPESARPRVGTIISTELFNDFKAQAAIFKSWGFTQVSPSAWSQGLLTPDESMTNSRRSEPATDK
jgi:hypothetical protein